MRKRGWLIVASVLVVVMAIAAAGVIALGSNSAGAAVTLEPANSAGADPFSASVQIGPAVSFAGNVHAITTATRKTFAADAKSHTLVATGTAPGLYGGSGDTHVCNPQQLVTFLQQNPAKAAAWAGVLGISPQNIASYVAGLTPVILTNDTLVTNHGYHDGRATTLQSVLEAGTAVMVDNTGTPRVKCNCGNPLMPPELINFAGARYRGTRWYDYSPTQVTIVKGGTTVTILTVININTGETYTQPTGGGAGSTGGPSAATYALSATAGSCTGGATPDDLNGGKLEIANLGGSSAVAVTITDASGTVFDGVVDQGSITGTFRIAVAVNVSNAVNGTGTAALQLHGSAKDSSDLSGTYEFLNNNNLLNVSCSGSFTAHSSGGSSPVTPTTAGSAAVTVAVTQCRYVSNDPTISVAPPPTSVTLPAGVSVPAGAQVYAASRDSVLIAPVGFRCTAEAGEDDNRDFDLVDPTNTSRFVTFHDGGSVQGTAGACTYLAPEREYVAQHPVSYISCPAPLSNVPYTAVPTGDPQVLGAIIAVPAGAAAPQNFLRGAASRSPTNDVPTYVLSLAHWMPEGGVSFGSPGTTVVCALPASDAATCAASIELGVANSPDTKLKSQAQGVVRQFLAAHQLGG